MKKIFTLFLIMAIHLTVSAQEFATAHQINQRLGRGINMGNAFEAPTETAWSNPWKPEYFRIMSQMGFSHVRIPIRWSTPERSMNTEPYTIVPQFLNRIKQVVDTALKYNLHPIINMHHHDDLFQDPAGQKNRFLAQWEQIADFFKDYPDSLVFEILNEPHGNLTPQMWNTFFAEALQIIRVTNPQRVVMIGTAPWGGLQGVGNLNWPQNDDRLILTVHFYNPFQFTHQGASWVEDDANQWLGTQWYDTQAERQAIMDEFAFTRSFATENNIPVHVGEFGAYSTADMDSRVRWTTFLARWFDELGYSWAYWEFSAGFGVYNPSSGSHITPLVNALIHNPMPQPTSYQSIPLYNTDFSSGTSGWVLNRSGGAAGSMSAGADGLQINITNGGTQPWNVQLIRQPFNIERNGMYRVTFVIQSSTGSGFTTYIGRASDPWTSYSGYNGFAAGNNPDTLSFFFEMKQNSDPNARLVFDMGNQTGSFTIKSIQVEQIVLQLSTGQLHNQNRPLLYPNPVHDRFQLSLHESYHELLVFDMNGKLMLTKKIPDTEPFIYVGHLAPGYYFVNLQGNSDIKTIKFLKL